MVGAAPESTVQAATMEITIDILNKKIVFMIKKLEIIETKKDIQ